MLVRLGNNEELISYPCRLKHKDGSIRHVIYDTSANIDAEGKFSNTRCFLRDVTEQKKAQLASQVHYQSSPVFLLTLSSVSILPTQSEQFPYH
jgi:hypothetical protein